MQIPQHALTRAALRLRIAAQRKVRAPFARRRAIKTARRIKANLEARQTNR